MSNNESGSGKVSYDQDQRTLSQIEAITKEITSSQPLTSDHQPLSTLVRLYTVDGDEDGGANENFIEGGEYLSRKYSSWRRVRGDGNCYYRAFLYSLCEQLQRLDGDDGEGDDPYGGDYDRLLELGECPVIVLAARLITVILRIATDPTNRPT